MERHGFLEMVLMEVARIEVRVQPRAGRNAVEVVDQDRLRVQVTAPPDQGKANEAAVALLAKRLGVARNDVRIRRGHKARNKLVEVRGIDLGEVLKRLAT